MSSVVNSADVYQTQDMGIKIDLEQVQKVGHEHRKQTGEVNAQTHEQNLVQQINVGVRASTIWLKQTQTIKADWL